MIDNSKSTTSKPQRLPQKVDFNFPDTKFGQRCQIVITASWPQLKQHFSSLPLAYNHCTPTTGLDTQLWHQKLLECIFQCQVLQYSKLTFDQNNYFPTFWMSKSVKHFQINVNICPPVTLGKLFLICRITFCLTKDILCLPTQKGWELVISQYLTH